MTDYTAFHYDILLAHMLRNQGIMQQALQTMQASDFQDDRVRGRVAQCILFGCFKEHYEQFKLPPDQAVVFAYVSELLAKTYPSGDPNVAEILSGVGEFYKILPMVGNESLPLAQQIIKYISKICTFERQVVNEIDTARANNFLEGLGPKLASMEQKFNASMGGMTVHGLGPKRDDASKVSRILTGIDFLDTRLGNGLGPMSSCGLAILAAQGSGKTTFGFQLCTSQCLQGKHAFLVLCEEGLSDTYKRKLIASATGVPYDALERAKDDLAAACVAAGMPADIAMSKFATLDKYLHVLDMTVHPGGIELIEGEVDRLINQGMGPSVIYIDWAGPLADYMMANASPGHPSFEKKEAAVKYLGDRVSLLGTRTNSLACISHQMAPAQHQKGPFANNDQFCGADSKGFTQSMKYVIVINGPCQATKMQWLKIAKARDDIPLQTVVVQLMGTLCRFREATGWAKMGKRFQQSNTNHNTLPQEQPKRNNTGMEGGSGS